MNSNSVLYFFLRSNRFLWIIILIVLSQLFLLRNTSLRSDEVPHFAQIQRFTSLQNPFSPTKINLISNKKITTPPLLHAGASLVLRVSNYVHLHNFSNFIGFKYSQKALFDLFLVRTVFALCFFVLLLAVRAQLITLGSSAPNLPLLLIFANPLTLPYIPLIYTDMLALGFILLGVISALARKPLGSALAILLACCIRQTSIVWICIPVVILLCDYLRLRSLRLREILRPEVYLGVLKSVGYHFGIGALFLIFIYVNKGIAVGDRSMHEVALNLSNIWFFSALFFVCSIGFFYRDFIQSTVQLFKKITLAGFTGLSLGLVGLYGLYVYTYAIQHAYNTSTYNWFIRNRLLELTTTNPLAKILFGVLSILGLILFIRLKFKYFQNSFISTVFKIVSLVSIGFMPLIENRYYIPIFGILFLFLALEKWEDSNTEKTLLSNTSQRFNALFLLQIVFNFSIAIYFVVSIAKRSFFL